MTKEQANIGDTIVFEEAFLVDKDLHFLIGVEVVVVACPQEWSHLDDDTKMWIQWPTGYGDNVISWMPSQSPCKIIGRVGKETIDASCGVDAFLDQQRDDNLKYLFDF